MGKARQVGFTTGCRPATCGLRLLAEGEVAQTLGIELAQQRLITATGVAHGVAQQGEDQCGLVDLAGAQLQVGHQQGVLQPLHQFGRKHRVARLAVLAARLQRLGQLAGIDLGILQGTRQQAFRALQQAQQQVFDEDLVAAAYHAAFGGHLQIALARGVQGLNQLLQVDVDHFICP